MFPLNIPHIYVYFVQCIYSLISHKLGFKSQNLFDIKDIDLDIKVINWYIFWVTYKNEKSNLKAKSTKITCVKF